MNNPMGLYVMAATYIVAGIMHFVIPKVYLKVIPSFLPYPRFLNYLAGAIEVVLGSALCFPETKNIAIYGILLLLLVFLICIHLYMLTSKKASAGIPVWILVLRIPMQFGLMYWAYAYLDQ